MESLNSHTSFAMSEPMEVVKRTLGDAAEVIEKLEFEKEQYLGDIESLAWQNRDLENEVRDLNDAVDSLCQENNELMKDNQNARKAFTGLQLAVSMLVFVYGMMNGLYLCPK